jgi:glycosyltransferase involved in cell wall biosynthesis
MKRDVIKEGINEQSLTAVPMGVDINSIPYSNSKDIHTIADKKKSILYLGTLDRNRHIEFLIHVMDIVVKSNPEAILYLVGKGEHPGDEEFIMNEVKSFSLIDSVIMTGFLPMDKAWQYVKKADVCVSPFYPTPILNSTSPTKLIEYMAMEKPVVANDHPEQTLVINESQGGLCVSYDVIEFANAINDILKNIELGEIMGKKGRKYVEEKRSYEVIAKNVMNKYHDLLA